MLINSNNVRIWGIIQVSLSVRYLQEYGSFHFTLDMLQVFSFDKKSRVHMHYLAKRQNLILCVVSPVSQNLYVEYLNQFHIFFAKK